MFEGENAETCSVTCKDVTLEVHSINLGICGDPCNALVCDLSVSTTYINDGGCGIGVKSTDPCVSP